MKKIFPLVGMLLAFVSVVPLHAAAIAAAPEIDGGSLTTGLGVLTGAVMILRARMRR